MRSRASGICLLFLAVLGQENALPAADQKVEPFKEAPSGLSAEVAAAINSAGYRITGKDGVVCDVWLAKEIPLKPRFKSTLQIKYPFQTGQLMGVIRFPEGSRPTDFRGQALKSGTYTLRYGLQPNDGNHLGTTEFGTRDFLVGCPPQTDVDPGRVEDIKDLFKLSAQVAGSTHPAIFLLIPPPDKAYDAAGVKSDDEKHLVILQVNANGKDGDKAVAIPMTVVTVGKTEG
jgi:hypothetical protein